MPSVPGLTLNAQLNQAAQVHNQDMVRFDFLSHTGSNGLRSSDRVTNAGYQWRSTGENIAVGQRSVNEVMEDWLSSPGHCRNIMSASFTEFGMAYDARYWTQVFARPR